MDQHPRREAILLELRRRGSVRVDELARQHRVTPMTVRRDLSELEGEGSLRRVHGGAVALAGPLAGEVRTEEQTTGSFAIGDHERFTLGIVVPDAHHYFPAMNLGATERAAALGGRAYLEISAYDETRELRLIQRMLRRGVDGLLVTTASPRAPRSWRALAEAGVPVVLMERDPGTAPESRVLESVRTDHVFAALTAVRELTAGGCRRIGAVIGPTASAELLREGLRRAAAEQDAVGDLVIALEDTAAGADEGICERIIAQVVERGVDGLLVHPDGVALELLGAARAAGLEVPADLAIVTSGDDLSAFAETPLSAMVPPRRDVGIIAAEMCVQRILAGASWNVPARHLQLTPAYRPRASTRVGAGVAEELASAIG